METICGIDNALSIIRGIEKRSKGDFIDKVAFAKAYDTHDKNEIDFFYFLSWGKILGKYRLAHTVYPRNSEIVTLDWTPANGPQWRSTYASTQWRRNRHEVAEVVKLVSSDRYIVNCHWL